MELIKINIPNSMGKFEDIKDLTSFTKTVKGMVVGRELNDWTFEAEDKIIKIAKVEYEFDYQITPEKITFERKQ